MKQVRLQPVGVDPRREMDLLQGSVPVPPQMAYHVAHGADQAWIVSCEPRVEWEEQRFRRALQAWIQRNPILRTSLTPSGRALCLHQKKKANFAIWPIDERSDRQKLGSFRASLRWDPTAGLWWQIAVEPLADGVWRIWFAIHPALAGLQDVAQLMHDLLQQVFEPDEDDPTAVIDQEWLRRYSRTSTLEQPTAPSPGSWHTLSWSWSQEAWASLKSLEDDIPLPVLWSCLIPLTAQQAGLLPDYNMYWFSSTHEGDRAQSHPWGLAFERPASSINTLRLLFKQRERELQEADHAASLRAPRLAISTWDISPELVHRTRHGLTWQAIPASPADVWFVCHGHANAPNLLFVREGLLDRTRVATWLEMLEEMLSRLHSLLDENIERIRYPASVIRLWDIWNQTERAYPLEQSLPQILAPSLQQHGHRIAVKSSTESMSYQELDRLSRAMAMYLHTLGVKPGDRIGLATPRSPLMVVALLGILSAGGSYVPLDPSFPPERLRYMLSDAKVHALLSSQEIATLAPAGARVLVYETLFEQLQDFATETWRDQALDSRSIAYVIYTSGSTGQPKGVMLSHRSVVNFLLAMREAPGMEAGDTILAVTTLSFDIAVLELLLPLLVGGRIYLATHEEAKDGKRLSEIFDREIITHFQATPSTFRLLLDAGWQGGKLRKALCGGEAFPADVARRLSPLIPEIWNMYGPTETTVWSSLYRVQGDETMIPIGRPIANTTIYVVDEHRAPVLPGQKGEIYIGGEGLALGYLGRQDLTDDRFVTLPHIDKLSYRTGDIGRFRWDGTLEIFGRADHQIKLRGYRMELGEIEAVVSRLPGLDHCVAAVQEFGADDLRLVAYVTLSAPWDERAVRAAAKNILPAYMLPQHYVVMQRFPLLPNGKIDRKQLPHPLQTPEEKDLSLPVRDQQSARALVVVSPSLPLQKIVGADTSSRTQTPTTLSARMQPQHLRAIPSEAADAGPWPLTPSQARMLYVEQLNPGTLVHNLLGAWALRGALDLEAFHQALDALMIEQEALRCYIVTLHGQQMIRCIPSCSAPLEIETIKLDETEAIEALIAWGQGPLDITQAPHARFKLLRLGSDLSILGLSTHHMFWDGFSYSVLWRSLEKHYKAVQSRQPQTVLPPSVPYTHYTLRRQQELRLPEQDEQRQYWQKRFTPPPDPLELALDWPRPRDLTHKADTVWIPWDANLEQALLSFAKQRGVTLYHVLLSASFVLLHRLSGQSDLVIGTPVHGRQQIELFELLGNFINIIALRVTCERQTTYLELLELVKNTANEGFANTDIPFEQVVASVKLPRDPSRTPLYTTMLFFQDHSQSRTQLGDVTVEPLPLRCATVDTDMIIWFERYAQRTVAGINFRTDLWRKDSVQAIAQAFSSLLIQLLTQAHMPIESLPLLDQETTRVIRSLGERHLTQALSSMTLEQMLHKVQQSHAQQTAVRTLQGRELNYHGLESKALRWAQLLFHQGVRRGHVIGICLNRDIDLLVALRAVIRLGAAYLPLDPQYPQDRLQYMAHDAKARMIITELEFSGYFEAGDIPLVLIDRDRIMLDRSTPLDHGVPGPRPDDLAYVIYTSGSTGKPKGVEIQHSAVMHFIAAIRQELDLPAGLRTLAITTISFDISVLEMFVTLSLGGTIILLNQEQATDGDILRETLDREKIQLLQATPASWRLLLESAWHGHSKLIGLCGGEALNRDLAQALVPRLAALWNVYGPTEATVWATAERIVDPQAPICIGKVLPSYEAYILDSNRQPLPLGTLGSLYLAGPGLARGYRFRSDLTEERFVPHWAKPREKMYDTGDLVRMRPDGRLEYVSRRDNQVKLRGYRIELGEIESCMSFHPAVKQAVCQVWELQPGDQRLVAYVVLHEGQSLELPELHLHLAAQLPAYMLPNHLVKLPSFTLTGSGKIDRKALPQPVQDAIQDRERGQSLSPSEERIASIFRSHIGIQEVGGGDNFFDLGGHSLLALRVLHRLKEDLGLDLKIRDLLMFNIKQLASRLERNAGDNL